MADEEELETWQANGRIVLRKFDRAGGVMEVMVNTGRRIQLSERERVLNQDRVVDEKMDPFANGTLSPVRIPESSSAQAIVDNPNTMTEEDLVQVLNGHHKTFDKKLSEITSPYVVRRMIALSESDEMDLTMKRVDALKTRLRELTQGDIPVNEAERVTGV